MLLGSKAAGYGHIQDPRFRYGRHCYSPKFPQHSRLSLWEAAPQWRCIQWTLEPPYYPPVFRKLRRIRRLDKRGEGDRNRIPHFQVSVAEGVTDRSPNQLLEMLEIAFHVPKLRTWPIARSITHDDSIGLAHLNCLNLAGKWSFLDPKWTAVESIGP
jgi:hypothetical protein